MIDSLIGITAFMFALTVIASVIVTVPARRHERHHRRERARVVGIPYDPMRKVR